MEGENYLLICLADYKLPNDKIKKQDKEEFNVDRDTVKTHRKSTFLKTDNDRLKNNTYDKKYT